jgi:tetratricopeptide (TPR) repeat protein
MAINKNKVMEAAQKFVEKGQLDKAIKEYLKIVEEDPKDVRVWLKLGDLHARKNAKQEATETYLRVALFYSEQGFYLKAVAVYKQVLKLDARLVEVNIKLAEVYRQLGLLSDAMQQYEIVAAFYHREGKSREALSTIRELVELDPENVATRIKLAELYSKEQMTQAAIQEFATAAEYLRAHGRIDDFIKVAERLVWHQPDNHAMNRELASLYLSRNDPRHALQKLQACFKADARDVETLALLASAFLALDQRQKTVSVWKELARILGENNQVAQALDVHRRILSVVPDDADSLAAVGGRRAFGTGQPRSITAPPAAAAPTPPVRGSDAGARPGSIEAAPLVASFRPPARPEPPAPPPPPPPPAPALRPPPASIPAAPMPLAPAAARPTRDSGEGIVIEIDDQAERTARDRPREGTVEATIEAELPPAPDADNHERIARILSEADVYIKYGIRDRAIAHLGRVFEIDADNVDARERLKEIYLALGKSPEAAAELVKLIELTGRSNPAQAEGYLGELAGVESDDDKVRALARRFRLRLPVELEEATPPPLSVDSVDVVVEPPSIDIVEGTEVGADFSDAPRTANDGTIEVDPGEVDVEVEASEPELGFQGAKTAAGHDDRTYDASLEDLDILAVGTDDGATSSRDFAVDPDDKAVEESIGVPTDRPASGTAAGAGALEDELDEADFYVGQGMVAEARRILGELLRRYPGHPLVAAKLSDVDTVPHPEEAPRRVIAKPLGGPDADTHYDLGLAYKEMGLHEEAIKEFALVRATPGRAVQCHLMIGLCQLERGKLNLAVDEFKAGLYVDGITERESLALYFELGAAYEALGDAKEAIYYFEKVAKRDPRFRDVDRRIDVLTGRTGARGDRGTDPRLMSPDSADDALNALDSILGEDQSS